MTPLHKLLLNAPDSQIDPQAKGSIAAWSNPPKAIELLRTLDVCIYSALASGLVIKMLESMLNDQMQTENTTHDELVKQASWREAMQA